MRKNHLPLLMAAGSMLAAGASYKVRVYEDHLAQSTASQLWSASSVPENE
jgi:hypothetical protein